MPDETNQEQSTEELETEVSTEADVSEDDTAEHQVVKAPEDPEC
jgi:hypothetical protein